MKMSDYPVGTHIVHDFDEYVKTERLWKPLDYMSIHLTFSELDHFQERGDEIEILAMPWSVVQELVATVSELAEFRGGSTDPEHILQNAIKKVKNVDN